MSKINQRSGLFDLKDMKGEVNLNFDAQLSQLEQVASLNEFVTTNLQRAVNKRIYVANALIIVKDQMRLAGLRQRTIEEYIYTFNRLINDMKIEFLDEITLEVIFNWLGSLGEISDVSKQSRLRVIKAILNRFYDNGWYEKRF
ncbi:hypothetical protein [Lysinibacillus xylanilyticus]|uniref:hypothetical protein n=1 Tax=Lysinibacillus xylanilyticus TaxID=582475 RepID=UPI003807B4C7